MGAQTSSTPLCSMLEDRRPESGGCRWIMITAYTRVRELGWDIDECQVPISRSMHSPLRTIFAFDRIETVAIVKFFYKHEQRVLALGLYWLERWRRCVVMAQSSGILTTKRSFPWGEDGVKYAKAPCSIVSWL